MLYVCFTNGFVLDFRVIVVQVIIIILLSCCYVFAPKQASLVATLAGGSAATCSISASPSSFHPRDPIVSHTFHRLSQGMR